MASDAFEVLPNPPSVPSQWSDAGSDTLRPSQLNALSESDVPSFRAQRPWRALIAIGVAACFGLIWLIASSTTSAPVTVAELPRARPKAALSQAPASLGAPAVTPAPSTAAVGIMVANSKPELADSFKTALSETPGTIPVTVNVSPSDAFVFKDGKRLGRGDVTINVAPGTKITLVARLDGHTPRVLVVDGSYTSLNIVLSRAQASQVAKPSTSQSKPNEVAASGDTPSDSSDTSDNPY